MPMLQILSMSGPAFTLMHQRSLDHAHRQWHPAIFSTLVVPRQDHLAVKIDIFGSQTQGFHQPQTRPVLQPRHQPGDPSDLLRKSRDLSFGLHGWQSQWSLRLHGIDRPGRQRSLQNLTVEQDQRLERLILSRCRNLPVDGQIRKKGRHLHRSHFNRMPFAMKPDGTPSPPHLQLSRLPRKSPHQTSVLHRLSDTAQRDVRRRTLVSRSTSTHCHKS